MTMHKKMAETLDKCIKEIKEIQRKARTEGNTQRPFWPMIVLRTPKGWTGPKVVDGKHIEGSYRAHQVPITMDKPEHLELLKEWLLSYKPEELFTEDYRLKPELRALAPTGDRRISANPHANGGKLLKDLRLPDFTKYGVKMDAPGTVKAQDMLELGYYIRDVLKLNEASRNFRMFGPDETMSNRMYAAFEASSARLRERSTTRLRPRTACMSRTITLRRREGSWMLICPSTCARAGLKDIFSRGVTGSLLPMNRLSVSSIPWCPSTQNG